MHQKNVYFVNFFNRFSKYEFNETIRIGFDSFYGN
jgi:hypothetical protein